MEPHRGQGMCSQLIGDRAGSGSRCNARAWPFPRCLLALQPRGTFFELSCSEFSPSHQLPPKEQNWLICLVGGKKNERAKKQRIFIWTKTDIYRTHLCVCLAYLWKDLVDRGMALGSHTKGLGARGGRETRFSWNSLSRADVLCAAPMEES